MDYLDGKKFLFSQENLEIELSSKLTCFTAAKKILGSRQLRKFVGDGDFLLGGIQRGNHCVELLIHETYEVPYFLIKCRKIFGILPPIAHLPDPILTDRIRPMHRVDHIFQ